MPVNRDWLKQALEITGDFETSGSPWSQATGDFDQQGISCGILQWNIGQGSLQPLVKAGGITLVLKYMPQYGNKFWEACNAPINQGLREVRSWQSSNRLNPTVIAELSAFFGSPEMVENQISRAMNLGERAYELAVRWAIDERHEQTPSLHDFCWFFDLLTMNGGMKNLWYEDVQNFIEAHSPEKADDLICDWLANTSSQVYGWKDSRKNAALWKNHVKPKHLNLFVLGYLRAQKSRPEFRALVMNRRGTIAITQGYVNGELEDLKNLR